MKRPALIFAFFTSLQICMAQSVSQDVISSAGDHFTFSSGSLSWTIGEPVSDTYTGSGNIVTKGFHQPSESSLISVPEIDDQAGIIIYPNPFENEFSIFYKNKRQGLRDIRISDCAGKQIYFSEQTSDMERVSVDMTAYAKGIYILKISSVNNESFFYRIAKQ